MSGPGRRDFLKRTAGAVPGAAIASSLGLGACAPEGEAGVAAAGTPTLPAEPLRAVADVVLPATELGADGVAAAVDGFTAWVAAFEPAAELDHPYLSGELRYGPPHPGPRWAAQLEALDLESRRRYGVAFADRPVEERRTAVARILEQDRSEGLPGSPARADHVAVGLLAWYYGTSGANDLCYRAGVGRHQCRGLVALEDEPGPVEGA